MFILWVLHSTVYILTNYDLNKFRIVAFNFNFNGLEFSKSKKCVDKKIVIALKKKQFKYITPNIPL